MIICCWCGVARDVKPTKKGEPRLPNGWKRRLGDDAPACDKCWKARYVLRAVTIPVAGPVDGTWDELNATLKTCFQSATALANAAVLELVKADFVRTPDMEKMPKAPRPYLYPLREQVAPAMDSTSATALLRSVEGKYSAARYKVLWTRTAAFPCFRYPMPYPVHNQSWTPEIGEGGQSFISLRLGGRRWQLRLRGGNGSRRALRVHRQILEGTAKQGELTILRSGKDLMCKIVAWLPKAEEARPKLGVMTVRTDEASLLVATIEGREVPWVLNLDSVRAWILGHEARIQRINQDTKREKRWPRGVRESINEDRSRIVERHRCRMDDTLHQVSHMVAAYAQRQNVASVLCDLKDRGYVSFPYYELGEKIRYKCEDVGIACVAVPQSKDDNNEEAQ